jgi:hypothetical protein
MVTLDSDGDQAKVTSKPGRRTTGLETGAVLTNSDRKTVFSTRTAASILGGLEASCCGWLQFQRSRVALVALLAHAVAAVEEASGDHTAGGAVVAGPGGSAAAAHGRACRLHCHGGYILRATPLGGFVGVVRCAMQGVVVVP